MNPILVTGAGGRVARALRAVTGETLTYTGEGGVERIHPMGWLIRADLNVVDEYAIMRAIGVYRPAAIINLAACPLPQACQKNPDNYAVNALAPAKLAAIADVAFCPIVHLSTDCVFSGTNVLPYKEDAQIGPANVYGEAKWEGEERLRAANERHVIIRTTGVFCTGRPNFLETVLEKAQRGEPMDVVGDTRFTPTDAGQLAIAIITATKALLSEQYAAPGTYHFAGPDCMSYLDFARLILEEAGLSCELRPVTAKEREAVEGFARPRNACLDSDKFARMFGYRHWNLRDCVREALKAA